MIDCYFIIFLNFRYTLLHVLEFDSTRKRMSVIVKSPQGFDIDPTFLGAITHLEYWKKNSKGRAYDILQVFSRVLLTSDIRLRLAHPSWVFPNAFPVSLLVRLSILLKSVEYQLLLSLRKGRHFWVTPKLRPFPFNMPCSTQICIAKCLYFYGVEDLPKQFCQCPRM